MKDVKLLCLSFCIGLPLLAIWLYSPDLFDRMHRKTATAADYLLFFEAISIGSTAGFILAKAIAKRLKAHAAVTDYEADQLEIKSILLLITGGLLVARGFALLHESTIESYIHFSIGTILLLYVPASLIAKVIQRQENQDNSA